MNDTTRLAELLCVRLCHELVSPVGAINSGVELISGTPGEAPEGVDAEALALLEASARKAAQRLKFYRVAYGGGSGAGMPLEEVRSLAEGVIANGRIRLDWPAWDVVPGALLKLDSARLILNLLALAAEALPRGGYIGVRLTRSGATVDVEIGVDGPRVQLPEEAEAAYEAGRTGALDEHPLTARTVHAGYTGLLVKRSGVPVERAAAGESGLLIRASLPI